MPEEIHINCSADSKVPDPPAGHRWAEVVHIPTASWLAYWKENINGADDLSSEDDSFSTQLTTDLCVIFFGKRAH
jgi:hypothetical protein